MRQGLNPLFILLNNSSYAIEEMVHPGKYNELKVRVTACWGCSSINDLLQC